MDFSRIIASLCFRVVTLNKVDISESPMRLFNKYITLQPPACLGAEGEKGGLLGE